MSSQPRSEVSASSTLSAPAPISKLAYIGVRTGDPEAMRDYYLNALMFTEVTSADDRIYLSPGVDHHAVVIEPGAAHGRARIGYQLRGSLDEAASRLKQEGIEAQRRTDPEPGVDEDLVIIEPTTQTPIHLIGEFRRSGVPISSGVTPTKLGHVAAFTPGLAEIQHFYETVLGFRWSDTIGDFFVFLRCNAEHHAANFMESQSRSGLHHVAYEMRDFGHLKLMLDHLGARNIRLEWGPGRHGPGHNIFTYHRDPDGNVVELFCEIDVIHDEQTGAFEPRPWHDAFPQVPRTWPVDVVSANCWGPINPVFLEH